jgi:hypothetical protein
MRVAMPSALRMTCRVETKGKEMLKGKLSLLPQKPNQCEATISEQIKSVLRFSNSFGMVVYQSFHLIFGLLWANIWTTTCNMLGDLLFTMLCGSC